MLFHPPQAPLAVLADIQQQHPGEIPVREAHH